MSQATGYREKLIDGRLHWTNDKLDCWLPVDNGIPRMFRPNFLSSYLESRKIRQRTSPHVETRSDVNDLKVKFAFIKGAITEHISGATKSLNELLKDKDVRSLTMSTDDFDISIRRRPIYD